MGKILKGIAELVLSGCLVASTVFALEKSGVTEAFVQYNDIQCKVYHELQQRYPYFFWRDWGDPNIPNDTNRLMRYRIATDVMLGGIFGALEVTGIMALVNKRKNKK